MREKVCGDGRLSMRSEDESWIETFDAVSTGLVRTMSLADLVDPCTAVLRLETHEVSPSSFARLELVGIRKFPLPLFVAQRVPDAGHAFASLGVQKLDEHVHCFLAFLVLGKLQNLNDFKEGMVEGGKAFEKMLQALYGPFLRDTGRVESTHFDERPKVEVLLVLVPVSNPTLTFAIDLVVCNNSRKFIYVVRAQSLPYRHSELLWDIDFAFGSHVRLVHRGASLVCEFGV